VTNKQEMSVAAVVVTYNRKNLLRKCLRRLLTQTRLPDKIFVIDNASTDGSSEMVMEEFPEVTLIRMKENEGGSGGFYEGISVAYKQGYEWIWVMDDDVFPQKDSLEQMINFIQRNNQKCVGCIRPNNTLGYPTPLFAGGLISKNVIEYVGLPRRDFFIYWDDIEYLWRIQRSGCRVIVLEHSVVEHEGSKQPKKSVRIFGKNISRFDLPEWKVYYIKRNAIPAMIMNRKYRSIVRFMVIETLLDLFLYIKYREWQKIKMAVRGLVDGFLGRLGKRVSPGFLRKSDRVSSKN